MAEGWLCAPLVLNAEGQLAGWHLLARDDGLHDEGARCSKVLKGQTWPSSKRAC